MYEEKVGYIGMKPEKSEKNETLQVKRVTTRGLPCMTVILKKANELYMKLLSAVSRYLPFDDGSRTLSLFYRYNIKI